jgi:hypothetical protein
MLVLGLPPIILVIVGVVLYRRAIRRAGSRPPS